MKRYMVVALEGVYGPFDSIFDAMEFVNYYGFAAYDVVPYLGMSVE